MKDIVPENHGSTANNNERTDEVVDVFGVEYLEDRPTTEHNDDFQPWHHPVKQIVRQEQWKRQLSAFIEQRPEPSVIRYFTLPGPDLLDVRCLAEVISETQHKIEYFGFDSSGASPNSIETQKRFKTEAALRQAGLITNDIIVRPDRLEDIANSSSVAAIELKKQASFDIINIDGCDHLAYSAPGRSKSTFDALKALIQHQSDREKPWLLWLTTRVSPKLSGEPLEKFKISIKNNCTDSEEFKSKFYIQFGNNPNNTEEFCDNLWTNTSGFEYLKLYTIGLAKYLLQLFLMQVNHPSKLELVCSYAYRVHDETPDMLAIAFRIKPLGHVLLEPGTDLRPNEIEINEALKVLKRAERIWNIDEALQSDDDLRTEAVKGIEDLLRSAGYSIDKWRTWLREHEIRPIETQAA